LLEALHGASEQSDVEIYLFGSILSCRDVINDIDVLVVYKCMGGLQKAKHLLEEVAYRIPLDITFMHVDEEFELQFVNGQRAVRVTDLQPNNKLHLTQKPLRGPSAGER
jgi:predicted nucleotidyltransferase